LKKIYPYISGISSQAYFVGHLFHAAGSKFLEKSPNYGADTYHVKIFNGKKPFNNKMKASFPTPLDNENLKIFFNLHISNEILPRIMSNFFIEKETLINKDLFLSALCLQFECFVKDPLDIVEDRVNDIYLKLINNESLQIKKPTLYEKDDFCIINNGLPYHELDVYEIFSHKWIIKNSGSIVWYGRYIKMTNQAETYIKSCTSKIDIPVLNPYEQTTITAVFDSRGIEGSFKIIMEIFDNENRRCFPDKSNEISLSANVSFNAEVKNE